MQATICGRSVEEALEEIKRFHGFAAPGLVIGALMVDWAVESLGDGVEAYATVESVHCLPDAVQIFTPCTYGNGWMKVLDWDKFALSLYDRFTHTGSRIWMDLDKMADYPNIYNWYMRTVPKQELPLEVLLDSIFEAGRGFLSSCPVAVTDLYQKKKKGTILVCPDCREAYPAVQGSSCLSCQGKGYYERVESASNEFALGRSKALSA